MGLEVAHRDSSAYKDIYIYIDIHRHRYRYREGGETNKILVKIQNHASQRLDAQMIYQE